jgi:hypothetical protein
VLKKPLICPVLKNSNSVKVPQKGCMYRLLLILFFSFILTIRSGAQSTKDTAAIKELSAADYDLLFSELDAFLDSLLKPRSFGSVSLNAGNRLLNVQSASGKMMDRQALIVSPSAGYYHKSGFGIGASAAFVKEDKQVKAFQYLATFSYDYLKIRTIATGVAYTRYFDGDTVSFYTSPLQNELSGYFMYRKSWLKPLLSLSYGWGSSTSVQQQETIIKKLKKKTITGTTTTTVTENVADFALSLSVRHDFYWLKVFSPGDNIRFTPQLAVSGGTQSYGLNQNSQTLVARGNSGTLKPFTSDKVALDETSKFQPLSVTAFLRTAYTKNKFYIQPQAIFDYYLPATTDKLSASFQVSVGLFL